MTAILQDPIFTDEAKAREWLEARVWPNGPVCPHCGAPEALVTKLEGAAHRPGVYQCNQCREQFTVTVGTVFERSKLPLTKWLAALFLMTASKKGISAHQVHRMLKISYKSTWFMMHRLREAMRPAFPPQIGGRGKTVEMDETYVGGLLAVKEACVGGISWMTLDLQYRPISGARCSSRLATAVQSPPVDTSKSTFITLSRGRNVIRTSTTTSSPSVRIVIGAPTEGKLIENPFGSTS